MTPTLPRRLSASALARFQTCPKQYYLADIAREPRNEEPSPILVQANAVHHALERFFGLPLAARLPENLTRALRSVWPQHRKPGAFTDRDDEIRYGVEAIEMLNRFSSAFSLDVQPLAREQWLTGRTESGVNLVAKLDRVDRLRDGVAVLDYKTGRRILEREDLRHEPSIWIYVALAEAAYRMPVEELRFVYLREAVEVVWQLEREDVQALKERLALKIEEIRTTALFEARPGAHCRFCPFALGCQERSAVSLDDLVEVEGLPF